jgi:hypothetical protein
MAPSAALRPWDAGRLNVNEAPGRYFFNTVYNLSTNKRPRQN